MHVYGESMCPNGCCNWTLDGCCQGNHGIPQEKLDAVESIDWMFITGDIASDMKEQNRHGHDHVRRKRKVDIVVEDDPEEDEEETNDGNEEQNGENR